VVSTSDSGEELGVTHPTVSSGAPSQLRESVGHYRHPGSRTGGARSVTAFQGPRLCGPRADAKWAGQRLGKLA